MCPRVKIEKLRRDHEKRSRELYRAKRRKNRMLEPQVNMKLARFERKQAGVRCVHAAVQKSLRLHAELRAYLCTRLNFADIVSRTRKIEFAFASIKSRSELRPCITKFWSGYISRRNDAAHLNNLTMPTDPETWINGGMSVTIQGSDFFNAGALRLVKHYGVHPKLRSTLVWFRILCLKLLILWKSFFSDFLKKLMNLWQFFLSNFLKKLLNL